MSKKTIGILGGGKWGTALGQKLSRNYRIKLYSREISDVGYQKTGDLEYFGDFAQLKDSETLIVAVPSFAIREVITKFKPFYGGQSVIGVAKGLEKETSLLPSQIVQEVWPGAHYAHLSGPSFAAEVSQGMPIVISLGVANLGQGPIFQEVFNPKEFKIEATEDLIGVQLGGALKNVIAIVSGLSDGLHLGESFRASLILSGLKEMMILGKALGAEEKTFLGPAGLGDLILTALSPQSRNYRLGVELSHNPLLKEKIAGDTFEGVITAGEAHNLSQKLGLRLPVVEGAYRTIYQNQNSKEALRQIQDEIC